MNFARHMEAAFTVALALAGSAALIGNGMAAEHAPARHAANDVVPASTVVVVSAARMSAAEKRQSLLEERRQGNIARDIGHDTTGRTATGRS